MGFICSFKALPDILAVLSFTQPLNDIDRDILNIKVNKKDNIFFILILISQCVINSRSATRHYNKYSADNDCPNPSPTRFIKEPSVK